MRPLVTLLVLASATYADAPQSPPVPQAPPCVTIWRWEPDARAENSWLWEDDVNVGIWKAGEKKYYERIYRSDHWFHFASPIPKGAPPPPPKRVVLEVRTQPQFQLPLDCPT